MFNNELKSEVKAIKNTVEEMMITTSILNGER